MKLIRLTVLPISWLYGIVTILRNKLYDWRLFSSTGFNVHVICIGNLTTGGTGKTPHVEYLIEYLSRNMEVAVLSRGYGRKTKGYLDVDENSNAEKAGDEPVQMKQKFPETCFAVDENRVRGISKLLNGTSIPGVIILDDAFQHRAVKPGLSIVLVPYHDLFNK